MAEVRARWIGHRLRAEVNVALNPELSVAEGHVVAREVNHQEHNRLVTHSYDQLPTHSH